MNVREILKISAPNCSKLEMPLEVNDRCDPYLQLTSQTAIRDYYEREGYVIFRNLIPTELCDRVKIAFEWEVKPYQGYLYRQPSSGTAEKHIFSEHGYMLNSILNIQDLNIKNFPNFRETGLAVLTHQKIYKAVKTILGEPGKLVQSMYFEGNPVTWAHQDTYYLDASELGRMTAAWIALEDIQPGAGRFYIYPGSHKIDMIKNGGDFDIAFNHSRYKALVLDVIDKYKLTCRAPAMRKGDVLFWSSQTIHGSLETCQPERSRCSFTAHFIPNSTSFLQFQKLDKKLNLRRVNDFLVNFPKDQNQIKNQTIMQLSTQFPKVFQFAKRSAIKLLLK